MTSQTWSLVGTETSVIRSARSGTSTSTTSLSTGPAAFRLPSNVDGLSINDVQLNYDVDTTGKNNPKLVEIGPMSQTYKFDANDPATWVELFSPDRDITVRGFRLTNVRVKAGDAVKPLQHAEDRLVRIADQKPNPNYPKTTPRGGTGKALLVPLDAGASGKRTPN